MKLNVLGNPPMIGTGSVVYHRAALGSALAAGAYCLLVLVMMLVMSVPRHYNPQADSRFVALTASLAKDKNNLELQKQIRQLDLELRERYFRQKALGRQGAWLLLGGAVAVVVSLRAMARYRARPAMTAADIAPAPDPLEVAIANRWAVASAGGVLAMGMLAMGVIFAISTRKTEPQPPGPNGVQVPPALAPTGSWPSAAEFAANWATFRGSDSGVAASGEYPLHWDGKANQGILWKTPMPLPGESSPVVWGKRVFVTGGTVKKRQVYCLDADTGSILWTGDVPGDEGAKPPDMEGDDTSGYAAPTMVVDGKHAVAIFATGDMACFDFDGKRLWTRSLGVPESQYGYSSSLALWRDRVIVQFDQGASADDNKSFLLALDVQTGADVWKTNRDVPASWPSPIVISTPKGDQIITAANPWVIAYDPQNGKELWRFEGLGNDPAPSPIYAAGMVYTTVAYAKLSAIRPDGAGNVTETHKAWESTDGLPDTASPVSDGELLFLATSAGTITCFDAITGQKVWDNSVETRYRASPAIAGKRLYVLDRDGLMHILAVGREFKELATAALGEPADTSPALAGGKIYIHAKRNLYCIGSK